MIRTILPVIHLFAPQPESAITGRPLVGLTFALNYAFDPIVPDGEWQPTSWRACNLLFHFINALLLLTIVTKTLTPTGRSRTTTAALIGSAVALVWAVHPLHTDSIAYISQRTVLMMSMFLLLTLYCSIRCWDSRSPGRWRMLAITCCAAGMLCKESMAIAPLIVFLYDRSFVSSSFAAAIRKHWRLHAGLAATWIIVALIVMSGPRTGTTGADHGVASWEYLLTQSQVIAQYFSLAFWPVGLSIHHEIEIVRSIRDALPIGLVTVLVFIITVVALWRRPQPGFLLACVFLALAPTSSIVPIVTEVAAERRMYLPVACLACIVVGIAASLFGSQQPAAGRRALGAAILGVLLAIPLGAVARDRAELYRSRETIWRDALALYPESSKILNNLATVLTEQGQPAEAIPYFERALDHDVDERTLTSTAVAYAMLGNLDQAESLLLKAVEIEPNLAKAHDNLGNIYLRQQKIEQALTHLQIAADQLITSADTQYRCAMALAISGDREQARLYARRAVQLRPGWAEAQALLEQLR